MAAPAHVIVNPSAGRSQGDWMAAVRPVFDRLGPVRWHEPASAEDTTTLARALANDNAPLVVAAGGDGTLFRVANGLVGSASRLGILPVGTANDFARYAGVPRDPVAAAEALVGGRARPIDVVRVSDGRQTIRLLTLAGFALIADAAMRADRMKRRWPWIGPAVYKIAAGISIVIHGGAPVAGTFVTNQPSFGGNLRLPIQSSIDDGRFEVSTLKGGSRFKLSQTLTAMSAGKPLPAGMLSWTSVERTTLDFGRDVEWFADGEGLGFGRVFEVVAEPRALTLVGAVAPSGGV